MDALCGRRVKPVERRFLGPSGAHSPPIRDHGRGGGGQDPRLGPRPVAIGGFRPAQEGSVKMGAAAKRVRRLRCAEAQVRNCERLST